jgi:hypothetical protein
VDASHIRRAIALNATLASLALSLALPGGAAASTVRGTSGTVASVPENTRLTALAAVVSHDVWGVSLASANHLERIVPLVERWDATARTAEMYPWRGQEKRRRRPTSLKKVGALALAAAIGPVPSRVGPSRDGTRRDRPTSRWWPRGPPPRSPLLDL